MGDAWTVAARARVPISLKTSYAEPKVVLSVTSDQAVTLRWQVINGLNRGWKDSHLTTGVSQPPVQNEHSLVLPCYNTVQCMPDRSCNLTFRFGQPELRTSVTEKVLDSQSSLVAGSGLLIVSFTST